MIIYTLVQIHKDSPVVKAIKIQTYDMEMAIIKIAKLYPEHGWIGCSFDKAFVEGYGTVHNYGE